MGSDQGIEGGEVEEVLDVRLRDRRSSARLGRVPARSRSVWLTVVTAIQSFVVVSRTGVRRMRSPGRRRPPAVGTLTSISVAEVARTSHSAAPEAWLSAAPGPQASTAASQ